MLRRTFVAGLIAAASGGLSGGVAVAQAKRKGPNGGAVVESEGHGIEFVNKADDLVFYLLDHDGSPLATKGIRARAIVQEAGKTRTIALAPAAPNLLVGKLDAPLSSKARVVFSAGLHGHNLSGRFAVD